MNASTASALAFAWTGAALFAASLGYFLFTYAVTFGVTGTGPSSPAALAADIALFSAFALHHSLFAREGARAWVARHTTPAVERAVYVWAASLMLMAVCALWQPLPGVAWDVRGAGAWPLRGIQLFGIWLTLRGAAVIDVWDLAGVRQARSTPNAQRPTPGQVSEFRTDGPYGWVRHPIYLGWFLLVLGMPHMTATRLLFASVSCAYILIAIPFEERSLVRASGGAYRWYQDQVRWKLVPRVY